MRHKQLHEEALPARRPAQRDKQTSFRKIISPREVYSLLLRSFGPQGWWPLTTPAPPYSASPSQGRKAWKDGKSRGRGYDGVEARGTQGRPFTPEGKTAAHYHQGIWPKLSGRNKFEICLGAILTQNVAWRNAERALENLNRAGLLSPSAVLNAPASKMRRLIRPSGFFIQKEARVRRFCSHILKKHPEGVAEWLKRASLDTLRKELLGLHGVGPETADSIMLYAAERPKFVVDAYTLRLCERMAWFKCGTYHQAQDFFEAGLPRSVKIWQEFHALIVRLCKEHCRKTPECSGCPLIKVCARRGLK
ncbi:MAG: hypothetical protein ABIG11_00380 [bacterium]